MGKPSPDQDVAACGLVCAGCDMMTATNDAVLAAEIAAWFKRELGKDVDPAAIHCAGCRGERGAHWSADCWILKCCVDGRGLSWCWQCPEFPCEKLMDWSKANKRYGAALERLKGRKREVGQA